MRQRILFAAAALVMALGLVGSADAAANQTRDGFTITDYDMTLGNPKAPVLVVEYAAPTCPFCAQFFMNVFPQFRKNWIDTGKAYFVFRVFPISPVDIAVEEMARCLPRDKYFTFMDMMYRNQPQWDPDGNDIPDVHGALVRMGQRAGLSPARTDSCIRNRTTTRRISDMAQKAARDYLIDHTPSIFIDGRLTNDVDTYAHFNAVLQRGGK